MTYLYVPDVDAIAFVDVYDKDEAADLTPAGKKFAREIVEWTRQNLRERHRRTR